jgi:phytoene synthase
LQEPSPEQVLSRNSKSFSLAGKLLPRDGRADAAVLYAWCRRADDAVDTGPNETRAARLAELRRELRSVYEGATQSDPLSAAFQDLVGRRAIPESYPRALLDGMETDLGEVRLRTVSDLTLYAYRVAGVVGLMMCHVLGLRDQRALTNAAHLGIAMQITNICRDVQEDWDRRRLYLPAELLNEVGLGALGDELERELSSVHRERLARTIERLLALADSYYRSADRGLFALPGRAAWAIRSARLIYAAIGTELRRRGNDVFAGRAIVPLWKKLCLTALAAARELAARSRSWFRRTGHDRSQPAGI